MEPINNEFEEVQNVRDRYDRRKQAEHNQTYSMLNPAVYMGVQERERAIIRWIKYAGINPLSDRILEIGCGWGSNLNELIRLGFEPENLVGNELLEDRAIAARKSLPEATKILIGDASNLDLQDNSFDIVYQSTVFTSILDDKFQVELANKMWSLTKPGGGILWYDFIYDNPKNPDVRGVSVQRITELFPYGTIKIWRVTLAPPINRVVTKIHPNLYTVFNTMFFLRTHVLCWISKEGQQ